VLQDASRLPVILKETGVKANALMIVAAATAGLGLAHPGTHAASNPWDRLVGEWRGEGRFLGGVARGEIRWEPVLGGRFVRLTVRVTVARDGADRVFEGHGYYARSVEPRTTGTWFDVEGHVYPIAAELSEGEVRADWGPAGSVTGRSVYRVDGETLVVTDSAREADGTFREFGAITYRRTMRGGP
jgi:hypothetical protein